MMRKSSPALKEYWYHLESIRALDKTKRNLAGVLTPIYFGVLVSRCL